MLKKMTWRNVAHFTMVLGLTMLVANPAWAGAADPFSSGLSTVQGWMGGSLASILALVALIAGVILSIGGRITTALAAFALALIIGLGDTIVQAMATM